MSEHGEYGARMERGRITAASGNSYTVESYDRPGLVSMSGGVKGAAGYAVGDRVIFCLFPDGRGMILGRDT